MTKGEGLDAYQQLQALPPQRLTAPVIDDVVDAAQALEPLAREVQEKMNKHQERVAGEDAEKLTEDEEAELQEILDEIREEECDIDPPTIDPSKMQTIAEMRELRSIDTLAPVLE